MSTWVYWPLFKGKEQEKQQTKTNYFKNNKIPIKQNSSSLLFLIISRLTQIWANYQNGNTGKLSSVTVFAFALGSLARVFTTLSEVDDIIILTGFIVGTVLNFILVFQVLYYWDAPQGKATQSTKTKPKPKSSKAE